MMFESIYYQTVRSTQEEAKKLSPKRRAAIFAEEQLSGRGRNGKNWISPKGNLYCTFVLPIPPEKIRESSTLSLVLGAVVAEGWQLQLKWPNDLFRDGAKAGGILGEGVFEGDDYYLLLGIGLNVSSAPLIDRPTATLFADLSAIREKIATLFFDAFDRWLMEGFTPFFLLWSSLLIHRPGDLLTLNGLPYRFIGPDPRGALLLEHQGSAILISAGELI